MIRVIYRWHVEKENLDEFEREWSIATNKIHRTIPDALGSFMLQEVDDENDILIIAKWDSIESWKAFWDSENPTEIETMQKLGKLISTEAYREVDDFTR